MFSYNINCANNKQVFLSIKTLSCFCSVTSKGNFALETSGVYRATKHQRYETKFQLSIKIVIYIISNDQ